MNKKVFVSFQKQGTTPTLGTVMPLTLQMQGERSSLRRAIALLKKAGEQRVTSPAVKLYYKDENGEHKSFIIAPHKYARGKLFVSLSSMSKTPWTLQELDQLLDYIPVISWVWI